MYDKLTKADIDKMQEEIDYRKMVVRKQALQDLKEAKAHGDLSENFEYYAAKRFNNQNNSRIRYLEKMIRTAVLIEDTQAEDEAGIGRYVRVRFMDEDEIEEYKIVTAVRGNSMKGLITMDSPLGRALLGHRAGDQVEVVLDNKSSYMVELLHVERADTDQEELRKF